MHTNFLSGPLQLSLALIVIPAAIFDVRSRRVPNWLTLVGLVMGIGLNTLYLTHVGLWTSLKGMGLALLVYVPLYLLRGVGAGDVKLMAAIGAITGPAVWLAIFLLTALFGGVAALALATVRGRLRRTGRNIATIAVQLCSGRLPFDKKPQLDVRSSEALRLPHALIIAFGALAYLWMQATLPIH